jgi:hypothetical protein
VSKPNQKWSQPAPEEDIIPVQAPPVMTKLEYATIHFAGVLLASNMTKSAIPGVAIDLARSVLLRCSDEHEADKRQ